MITIVIPTYNEARNIKKIIPQIQEAVDREHEILVVDDDSPDKTWKVVEELSGNVRVIRRQNERGLSSAVLRGFSEAKGEIVGVMDADLSHPPDKIPELLDALENHDLVVGSRLVEGGGVEDWPFRRKLISFVATLLAKPLTRVKDPMSGFFIMKRAVVDDAELNPLGYKILLEILVKGDYSSLCEVPFTFRNREVGDSKLGMKLYLQYLAHLAKLYVWNACHRSCRGKI